MAKNVTIGNKTYIGINKIKVKAPEAETYHEFFVTDDATATVTDIISGKTAYIAEGKVEGTLEEETKIITPDFSSGNVVVTPTSGKVMTQVTINKDSNLIPENIKKDVTVHGVTGTLESGGGETEWFDYSISGSFTNSESDVPDGISLVFLFGRKGSPFNATIGGKTYYYHRDVMAVAYSLATPDGEVANGSYVNPKYVLHWGVEVNPTSIDFKAPLDSSLYECLGLYYATPESGGSTTLTMTGSAYKSDKATATAITNGNYFSTNMQNIIKDGYGSFYGVFFGGAYYMISNYANFNYLPKLTNISLYVSYYD